MVLHKHSMLHLSKLRRLPLDALQAYSLAHQQLACSGNWIGRRIEGKQTRIPYFPGLVAAYLGKLKQASEFIHHTMEIRSADHDEEGAALALVQLALINAEFGFRQRARIGNRLDKMEVCEKNGADDQT